MIYYIDLFMMFHVSLLPLVGSSISCLLGIQGLKNIRSGGDSSGTEFEGEGPYLTYIVYRSFKFPPPIRGSASAS